MSLDVVVITFEEKEIVGVVGSLRQHYICSFDVSEYKGYPIFVPIPRPGMEEIMCCRQLGKALPYECFGNIRTTTFLR